MFVAFILFTLVSGLFVYVFYEWATQNQNYFVKHKMKHLQSQFLIGNTFGLYLNRYPSHIFLEKIYNSHPKEKLIGFFDFRQPIYMACDAGLISQVGTTYFDHFVDRIPFVDIQSDTMYGKSILLLCGDKWRSMRSTLAPAFTGSKIRKMFGFVADAANNFTKSMILKSQQSVPVRSEMLEFFASYTAAIMSSCTFGLEIDSFENPLNGFLVHGKRAADFSGLKIGLRIILLTWFPRLMSTIDFEFVPQCVRKFFKSTLLDSMSERQSRQIFRPDVVNTLMEIRNERLKHSKTNASSERCWTDDELAAQCFALFVVAFDTSANVLAFMSYELALDQDIQQKLYEEIRMVSENLDGGQLTFDALSKLKYLDQVIDETLRKWPPALLTTRKCTKDIELDLGDGKVVNIERGMGIWIPVSSIQNDPTNFAEPTKFDPERFNEENKPKIKAGAFIPFGIGPRQCIASRLALMGVKSLFFYLLLNFSIEPYERTQIPLRFANTVTLYKPEKGIHLEFKPRS